jgi:phenylacetate-CoA ligase
MSQCPEGNYHISPEYGIIEILREDGTQAGQGEEGRILSTSLHNMAFPLLRYDTGDYVIPAAGTCACGRTLPIVGELTGRVEDKVLDTSGRWVSSLHRSFKFESGIRCSQIVQNAVGSIDVYIVPADGYNQTIQNNIVRGLLSELGDRMEIRVHIVRELLFRSSKKFKFVINRIQGLKET